ncbi:transmembrane protein Pmi [Arctopsyche grandis]|uniref:transmembrane protein Pmi n=1 Tax=Arctopsyche grandis TaxID=121162 RepID=UPI00406D7617
MSAEPELPLHPLAPPLGVAPQPADLRSSNVAVIREVYDSENFLVKFEMELEHALEAGCAVIVIEPERLAEVTQRWIIVGNALHKIAVYSGIASIITGAVCKPLACAPFGILSMLCTSCYTLSWQTDPCCRYQKETNPKRYLPVLAELSSATPLILVRTDNTKKIALHCSISIAAALVCLWRVYKILK